MADITAETLARAKASLDLTPEMYEEAREKLQSWDLEVNDDMVRSWMALKILRGASGLRLTKKIFASFQVRVDQTTSLSTSYWLVMKKDLPQLPAGIVEKAIDPASIADFPSGIDKDTVWILSKKVPLASLPDQVCKLKSSCSTVRSLAVPHAAGDGSSIVSGPSDPAPANTVATGFGTAAGGTPVPSGTMRVLGRDPSDPVEPVSVDGWAETLAVNTEKCFDNKQFYGLDRADPTKAIFWLRSYKQNVAFMVTKEDPAFTAPIRRYLSYVAQKLLDEHCLDVLQKFVTEMKEIEGLAPALLTPLSKAIMKLAETDLAADEGFDLNFLAQWPDRKNKFHSSTLFADYGLARFDARKALAKSPQTDTARRALLIDELLSKTPTDKERQELEVMKTLLSAVSQIEKMVYLVGDSGRAMILKEWIPNDGRVAFEPYGRSGGTLQDCKIDAIAETAQFVMKSPAAIEATRHPMLQLVLKEWGPMLAKIEAEGMESSDRVEILRFVNRVFTELLAVKTEMAFPTAGAVETATVMRLGFIPHLVKSVSGIFKKFGADEKPGTALVALREAWLGQKKKEEAEVEQKKKDEADALALEKKDDANSEERPATTTAEASSGPAQGQVVLNAQNTSVGQLVRVISKTEKAIHGKLAKVTIVNDASLWVKIVDGTAGGEPFKRTFKQVKPADNPGDSSVSGLVAAAGSDSASSGLKRLSEDGIETPLAKSAKIADGGNQKAMAIFGKASLEEE